jgi:hypothetical protein
MKIFDMIKKLKSFFSNKEKPQSIVEEVTTIFTKDSHPEFITMFADKETVNYNLEMKSTKADVPVMEQFYDEMFTAEIKRIPNPIFFKVNHKIISDVMLRFKSSEIECIGVSKVDGYPIYAYHGNNPYHDFEKLSKYAIEELYTKNDYGI